MLILIKWEDNVDLIVAYEDARTSFFIDIQGVSRGLAFSILQRHGQDEGEEGRLVAHQLARPPGPSGVEHGHDH